MLVQAYDYEFAMEPKMPHASHDFVGNEIICYVRASLAPLLQMARPMTTIRLHPGRMGPISVGEGLPMRGPPPFRKLRPFCAGKCGPRFQP